jgi:hypothetical protein
MEVVGPFLVLKIACVAHILRGHDDTMVVHMAVRAIETAHIHLGDEQSTAGALPAGITFVNAHHKVLERPCLK